MTIGTHYSIDEYQILCSHLCTVLRERIYTYICMYTVYTQKYAQKTIMWVVYGENLHDWQTEIGGGHVVMFFFILFIFKNTKKYYVLKIKIG